MSSSSKKWAVIQELDDNHEPVPNLLHVVKARTLPQFTDIWVNAPNNWPESVVWYKDTESDEDDDEGICKVLMINTKSACDQKLSELFAAAETAAETSNNSDNETNYQDPLLISKLTKRVDFLENQFREFSKPNVSNNEIVQVGTGKNAIRISVHSIALNFIHGVTASGLLNLAELYLGSNFYEGRSWSTLDANHEDLIKGMLTEYVRLSTAAETNPEKLASKGKKIHKQFVNLLNNKLKDYRKSQQIGTETGSPLTGNGNKENFSIGGLAGTSIPHQASGSKRQLAVRNNLTSIPTPQVRASTVNPHNKFQLRFERGSVSWGAVKVNQISRTLFLLKQFSLC